MKGYKEAQKDEVGDWALWSSTYGCEKVQKRYPGEIQGQVQVQMDKDQYKGLWNVEMDSQGYGGYRWCLKWNRCQCSSTEHYEGVRLGTLGCRFCKKGGPMVQMGMKGYTRVQGNINVNTLVWSGMKVISGVWGLMKRYGMDGTNGYSRGQRGTPGNGRDTDGYRVVWGDIESYGEI